MKQEIIAQIRALNKARREAIRDARGMAKANSNANINDILEFLDASDKRIRALFREFANA